MRVIAAAAVEQEEARLAQERKAKEDADVVAAERAVGGQLEALRAGNQLWDHISHAHGHCCLAARTP